MGAAMSSVAENVHRVCWGEALQMLAPGDEYPGEQEPNYRPGPLHERLPGVGEGVLTTSSHTTSAVYDFETTRNYGVYRCAGYKRDGPPAAFMIFLDDDSYRGPQCYSVLPVLDNLVHNGDMPPNTVAIFIAPAIIPGQNKEKMWYEDWENYTSTGRYLEYDSFDDLYPRLLIEELLPAIEAESDITLTRNPRLRGICGMSSGGLCAFNAAFQRPEAFQKVISHCGSYACVKSDYTKKNGGHLVPVAVRMCKPSEKPIRVFLQSGTNDADAEWGNWLLQNKLMQDALRYTGIEHRFEWGVGGHDYWHGTAIMPETLLWLWHDWKDEDPNGS